MHVVRRISEEEAIANDEFIKNLEQEGYLQSQARAIPEKDIAAEIRKAIGNKTTQKTSGFIEVKQGLDNLVLVQTAIDKRMRIDNSAPLYLAERIVNLAVAKVNGRPQQPKTLEDLFDVEVDVIRGLSISLTGALAYSEKVLDCVVDYRDNVVLTKFTGALEGFKTTEAKSEKTLLLFNEAEKRIGEMRLTDAQYPALYKAHSALRREMLRLDNDFSKYNQSLVFRTSELDVLNTHFELVNYAVLLLDRVNNYVADITEHVDNTKEVYRFFRESYIGMEAVYSAFTGLSKYVMIGAREMGEQISRMSEMTKATGGENMLPNALGKLLSGYKAQILAADSRSRTSYDKKAEEIRNSHGIV